MVSVAARANNALDYNPPAGDALLTTNGSNWLWAVTAIFLVSFFAMFGLTFAARAGEKIFHYLFAIGLLVGTITYYASASDLGWDVIGQSNSLDYYGTRQIFFTKYILWVVEFPVVILATGLLSNVSWATIVYNIFLSWIWVISYLVGAYTQTNYKWGFFAFGTLAMAVLTFSVHAGGYRSSSRIGVGRDHSILAGWIGLLWLLYVIGWGVSDGGNRIGVVGSWVWFGILDLLLLPVTGFLFLFLSRRWDYGRLNLNFTQYGRTNVDHGHFPEKERPIATAPLATTAAPGTAVV
jgi:bacteriorhodopsin